MHYPIFKSEKHLRIRWKFTTNLIGEHLVDVGIQNDPFVLRIRHETIPVTDGLESIMNHNDGVVAVAATMQTN